MILAIAWCFASLGYRWILPHPRHHDPRQVILRTFLSVSCQKWKTGTTVVNQRAALSFVRDLACEVSSTVPASYINQAITRAALLLAQCPSARKDLQIQMFFTSVSRPFSLFHNRLHMLNSCYFLVSQILTFPKFPRWPILTYYVMYGQYLLDWLHDCDNKNLSVIVFV